MAEYHDAQRVDWLNEDHQRLEEVFGAMVRNECGGDLRAIVDARLAVDGVPAVSADPGAMFDRFIANEAAKLGIEDRSMKNLIGGIKAFRQSFIDANASGTAPTPGGSE